MQPEVFLVLQITTVRNGKSGATLTTVLRVRAQRLLHFPEPIKRSPSRNAAKIAPKICESTGIGKK
jgi:hypothetical protein